MNLPIFFVSPLVLITGETDTHIDINRLGGTIKTGVILNNLNSLEDIKGAIVSDLQQKTGRKVYGLTSLSKKFNQVELNRLGIKIKKAFDSSRFVTSKEKELSSVIITKEKLLEKGGDYYVIEADGSNYLGKATAVQDFKDFDHRDYDRPRVDPKSGMLPPKLARIMVNLGGTSTSETILDPFCGSGTILQRWPRKKT